MPIITMSTLSRLSSCFVDHELVQYDSARYRKNPTEKQWAGRKIAGLPVNTLALVASKGCDDMGDFISLFMAVPKTPQHTLAA